MLNRKFSNYNSRTNHSRDVSKHKYYRVTNYDSNAIQAREGIRTFLRSTEVQLIIFDLHGTITNRTSIHPYHIKYRNKYIENKLGNPLSENHMGGTDETFALFPQLDKHEFYKFRDNDPLFDFGKIHLPNPLLAVKLKSLSKRFKTILYTDSYLRQIERTLISIGIHDTFDSIIGMENGHRKSTSQFTIYPELCSNLDIEMSNILIVGDRMDKDINPVLQVGGNGIQIESSAYILDAIELINKTFTNKT